MVSSAAPSIVATLSSLMIALLVGLLIVAVGAAGTFVALFARNPAKAYISVDRQLIGDSANTETRPRNRIPTRTTPVTPRPDYDPSPNVRMSPARRLVSGLMLLMIAIGVAMSMGAILSAIIVIVVTVLS